MNDGVRTEERSLLLRGALLAGLALTLNTLPGHAQARFSVDLFGGAALNAPTSLTLRQHGQPPIELTAEYETRPLEQPYYWSLRLGLHRANHAWELQLFHQKLFLTNAPAEVEHFEITHGFNILTVNYARPRAHSVVIRAGAGVVIPNVTARVRGEDFSSEGGIGGSGYRIGGPALLVGAGRSWRVIGGFHLDLETLVTAGWANVPVRGGEIRASNLAGHVRMGLGYTF